MRQFCGYGLVSTSQAYEYATAVCDVLGHGANAAAVSLILETAAQETHIGLYRDPTPNGAGRGLCQMDEIGFRDVQIHIRAADAQAIRSVFGVDFAQLKHESLDHSPLLSFLGCRLFYKRKPELIPQTLEARAEYYKKHYNTFSGKATIGEYILNAKRFLQ